MNEQTNMLANSVCEKALRAYFGQNKEKVVLKSGAWYDSRVDEIMKSAVVSYHGLTQPL